MIRTKNRIKGAIVLTLGMAVLLTAGCDGLKAGFNAGVEESVTTIITQTVARVFHLD